MDLALVAPDHGADVIAHAREQRLAIGGLAVRALKDPGAGLRMPDQIVPDDLHVAVDAELDVAIRRLERVAIGRRLRRLELQHVLRADLVELLRDDVDGRRVVPSNCRWLMATPITIPLGIRSLSATSWCAAAVSSETGGKKQHSAGKLDGLMARSIVCRAMMYALT